MQMFQILNGMGHNSQNFIEKRLIGYAESHDEERLMYRNLLYGASSGSVMILQTLIQPFSVCLPWVQ